MNVIKILHYVHYIGFIKNQIKKLEHWIHGKLYKKMWTLNFSIKIKQTNWNLVKVSRFLCLDKNNWIMCNDKKIIEKRGQKII